ncbi:MAG: hypothetical protein ACQKBV_04440 [Puniceicoccales bacterium]
MDIDKIKERLAAIRPDSLDSEDPEVAELLALVEEDLELAEWFAQEQVFDRAFASKLHNIDAPEGLEDQIVAAMIEAKQGPQADESEDESEDLAADNTPEVVDFANEARDEPSERGTAVPFQPRQDRAWWRSPGIISMAAGIVLLLGFSFMLLDPHEANASAPIEEFYSEIEQHHISHLDVDYSSQDMKEIIAHLEKYGAPVPEELPPQVDVLPEVGCSIMRWGGEMISVIRMDPTREIDLYIVRRGLFPKFGKKPQPQVINLGQVTVLGWSHNDEHYFLVQTGALQQLQDLL